LFGGKEEVVDVSVIKSRSDVTGTPGMEPVSPAMEKALKEANAEDVEVAQRTGSSSLPIPIAPPVGRVEQDEASLSRSNEDPLARWRRIQEERQKREELQQQKTLARDQDPNAEAINNLSTAMAEQMLSILEGKVPTPMQSVTGTDEEAFFTQQEEKEEARQEKLREQQSQRGEGGSGSGSGGSDADVVNIIVPAATIEYAQLMIEANSDVPGPVMAEVMSGPLVGSRLLGDFEVQDEYLTLSFDTLVIDGVGYSIDAIALDMNTTLPGVVTDVDHRYFQRIVLPAAAAFIEGMSSAIADTGGTTVSTSGTTGTSTSTTSGEPDTEEEIFKGIEEAGKTVAEILDDEAAGVEIMVKVAAGTPMGVLFLEPVTDESF